MRDRRIPSFVVIGIAIVSAIAPAAAQAPAQPPAAPAPGAPQAKPPQPPHKFSGTITAGISLESGRTDLNATQFVFKGRRPYSTSGAFTTSAGYTRATTRPPRSPVEIKVADRLEGNAGIEQNYGKRMVLMVRGQAVKDPIQRIDYSIEQLTGVGVRLERKRVQARVIPGLALLYHDKNVQTENGFNVNWGVYQDLKVELAPGWSFTEFINTSRDFKDKDDYTFATSANLTGAITKRLGIQLSYQYSFEKLLPVGVEPWYQKVLAGLQITF